MEYSKLVAVTGLPGLFELINSKNDGAIVRSLEDGSTRFASSRIHQFSHLESIEVYTVRDNVNLVEIFQAMDAAGGTLPDTKDNAKLNGYFEKTYPDLDFERVYSSDLKKMVKWFEVLKKKNIELKLSAPPEEEVEEVEEVEEKPAKKAAAKKEKAPKEEVEEKPAKKAATKKEKAEKEPKAEKDAKPAKKATAKKADDEEKPAKKAAPKKK